MSREIIGSIIKRLEATRGAVEGLLTPELYTLQSQLKEAVEVARECGFREPSKEKTLWQLDRKIDLTRKNLESLDSEISYLKKLERCY